MLLRLAAHLPDLVLHASSRGDYSGFEMRPEWTLLVALVSARGDDPRRLSFNRHVRPILAEHCFRCHGPDGAARKRGLRLDTPEGARATLADGLRAIVPGDPGASEVVARITATDPDEVMPPPSLRRPLDEGERALLVRWIREGAEYEPHWAFVAPRAAPPPAVRQTEWCRDPLDRIVLALLEREGLAPNPEAERATLLRRSSLVLTGLPPTPEETARFEADPASDACERVVDALLASPRFGEHAASAWLDAARYADTFGYQSDWENHVWPWRDWVIAAFDANLPYDQFLRAQLAGDLAPDATHEQRIATTFNRLHRMTNEGGSIDEEFRQEALADRVATYGTAMLGLTLECARCHDHKYDPVPQRDFYALGAFFGAIDEAGTYAYSTSATPRPALRLASAEQRAELARRRAAVAAAQAELARTRSERAAAFEAWRQSAASLSVPAPVRRDPLEGTLDGPLGKATHLDGDSGPTLDNVTAFTRSDPHSMVLWMRCPERKARATVIHTSVFTIETDQQGYQLLLEDGRLAWQIVHFWPGSAAAIRTLEDFPLGRWVEVAVTYDGSSRASGLGIYLDGAPVPTEIVRDHLDGPATARTFQVGFRDRDVGFKEGDVDELRIYDRELCSAEVAALHAATPLQPDAEFYFRNIDEPARAAAQALRAARAFEHELLESIPELMVMEATEHPRPSFVLTRGAYDRPDLERPVAADHALDALLRFDPGWPHDRRGLAEWTVDPRNPLTARVAVNRLWGQCFGRGIVTTQENFGTQGEPPANQELLDTLAVDFVQSAWNVKALLRRIVLSATFRQSSEASAAKRERDPENRLLARGPSVRLTAEMLRDQALAASGLLAEAHGGPSVKPWQPAGLWEDAGVSTVGGYTPDTGANAHRRSLYTFRKRTAPPPEMLIFDAGSRETCLARRQATNTPLQALALFGSPTFFECAQALARLVANESGPNADERLARAFRRLAGRAPRAAELDALRDLVASETRRFAGDPESARRVLGGEEPDPSLAALTLACSTLLASDAVVCCR